ncbi:metallophosphoesterase [Paenibacillus sp. N4]|nr:metallophosphoesterase [Paenibacillus vietnamensis]
MLILPTQWLKTERVRYDAGIHKKILQISDLHADKLRIRASRIVKLISAEKPDYIMLTGDFTRKESCLPKVERYLKVIADSGVPAYAVLGNHDYELPRLQRLLDLFEMHGIRLLRNESVVCADFVLVGIDDDSTRHSRVGPAFEHVDGNEPVIVITHDPNVVLKIKRPYHYLMAGHLHGKQLNVPFFFKFKPKGPLPAHGIYKGMHETEQGVFYISKGIGQAGFNARFMVRSEVTVHEL